MITSLLAAALALQSAPEPPALSQSDRALLRCSAAFAIIADGQARGNAAALRWPDVTTRGREFFVRALAQLMDTTGLDRAGINRLASDAAQQLRDSGETERIMPSCLIMLESSGL